VLNEESPMVLVVRWLLLAASVWVAAELLSGIELEGIVSTLVVAALLGLLNLYIRPALVLLTLPFTIVTFGLFLIVVNAILLGLVDWLANLFDDIHFEVETIGAALLGAVIISLVNMTLNSIAKPSSFA
jgi:putative membrane protein